MNPDSNGLALLNRRRSVPVLGLGAPGPTDAQIDSLVASALRVPDHGKLTPWRLLLLQDADLRQFGDWLAEHHKRIDPELPEALAAKDRDRYRHAPCMLVLIASLQVQPKIPEIEQWLSTGCVGFAVLLAAQAMGFGAQWLTGWAAYDVEVMRQLGLSEHERIAGFLHIGSVAESAPERLRPALASKLSRWSSPH